MRTNIYADNAATTQLDIEAFEEMKPFLLEEFANPSQPYSFSKSAKKAINLARETIAECINASADEIVFTSGGSESDSFAINYINTKEKYGEVITSPIEHHAILNACNTVRLHGKEVKYVRVNGEGTVLEESLSEIINPNTQLVSIMLANNEVGSIQPIRKLSEITHSSGGVFHTDAVQAVGHIGVDVKALDVDLLSASAHKFNGPKGIGFIYIKRGIDVAPLVHGGAQENNLRGGTENVACIVGMAKALKNNINKMASIQSHLANLEMTLVDLLNNYGMDFIRNGSENHIPGNISLSFRGIEGEMLLHRLDLMGIYVSTGSACDSKSTQLSHVIKAIGVDPLYANGTIRISFGKNNTLEDAITIANAVKKIIKK